MDFEIRYNKTFLKELAKIPAKQRVKIEYFVFEEITQFKSADQIPQLKKLKGFNHFYRIRFGNYRAGVRIQAGEIIFERILHRKDIYNYYP
ncbi:type II toxin-antitoxin system RelE/ParE family toxin [Draconibacterium orientale]|uniref:type II toxin-antitoxin system RelE family toxin n=1 Tax=Draconibacterium orientale TaxID=1168034 RepID=UPI002A0A34A1|nr:type II toxin-antitoxin system RelE/ParE family toxin [Draconibacterium orientale]